MVVWISIGWYVNRNVRVNYLLTALTNCGLVMPYSDIDPGQHWHSQWVVTWTSVDFLFGRLRGIHLRAISVTESAQSAVLYIHVMSLKVKPYYCHISLGPMSQNTSYSYLISYKWPCGNMSKDKRFCGHSSKFVITSFELTLLFLKGQKLLIGFRSGFSRREISSVYL